MANAKWKRPCRAPHTIVCNVCIQMKNENTASESKHEKKIERARETEKMYFAHMRKSSVRNRCRWWCISLQFYLLHHCLAVLLLPLPPLLNCLTARYIRCRWLPYTRSNRFPFQFFVMLSPSPQTFVLFRFVSHVMRFSNVFVRTIPRVLVRLFCILHIFGICFPFRPNSQPFHSSPVSTSEPVPTLPHTPTA